ncbi:MAG: tyrosine-type recombinase/integrase [Bacteroidota bacterium]|nr:tyrosine-type recombinase/integrase [Bacteroidota bacterium]
MKTIIESAKKEIKGFKNMSHKFERDLILNGKTQKTYKCYIRQIAAISLEFKKLPTKISNEEIKEYLFKVKTENDYSESYFKFTVYGLRYLFRLYNLEDKLIKLPPLPKKKTLPVVLSQAECIKLFAAPEKFKDKFMLALIYSAGLRISESQRIARIDIDTERKLIYVCQGKGKKDRYVVLSKFLASRYKKYCNEYKIKKYVFPGQKEGNYISKTTIRKILKHAVLKAGIEKTVTIHTLRHSFATHMLENGIDIVTVKEQLGHENIQTTMEYLQVARFERKTAVSPLDSLYGIK